MRAQDRTLWEGDQKDGAKGELLLWRWEGGRDMENMIIGDSHSGNWQGVAGYGANLGRWGGLYYD